MKWGLWPGTYTYHIWPCVTSHAAAAWAFGVTVYRQTLSEIFFYCPSMIRNCITVAITAAIFGINANVFDITSKWRHVDNNYSKVQMNFSPKLGSFEKKIERQIRNQWRQIYPSKRIHREYNNFFQGGIVPLTRCAVPLKKVCKMGTFKRHGCFRMKAAVSHDS